MTEDELLDWKTCLYAGIQRCETVEMLNTFYLRWKPDIEAHQDRDEIIGRFRDWKQQILCQKGK